MKWPFVRRSRLTKAEAEAADLRAGLVLLRARYEECYDRYHAAVNGLINVKDEATPHMANIGKQMVAQADKALAVAMPKRPC